MNDAAAAGRGRGRRSRIRLAPEQWKKIENGRKPDNLLSLFPPNFLPLCPNAIGSSASLNSQIADGMGTGKIYRRYSRSPEEKAHTAVF